MIKVNRSILVVAAHMHFFFLVPLTEKEPETCLSASLRALCCKLQFAESRLSTFWSSIQWLHHKYLAFSGEWERLAFSHCLVWTTWTICWGLIYAPSAWVQTQPATCRAVIPCELFMGITSCWLPKTTWAVPLYVAIHRGVNICDHLMIVYRI